MSVNIKVAVRVRPLLLSEQKVGHTASLLHVHSHKKEITATNGETSMLKTYKFDRVFDQAATQESIFRDLHIQSLIKKVTEGFHATIFAYGQTGSGKTYTMEGSYDYGLRSEITDEKSHGITFRSISELFDQIKIKRRNKGRFYRVYCSFLQIYNEKIYDLLNANSLQGQGLRLRWNKEDQFKVENLFVFEVENAAEAKEIYLYGIKNRAIAAHNLNLYSSRSHCIFSLTIEAIDANNIEQTLVSKLQLVDLAGSERASMTGNNNNERHLKESIDINKSLFTLRKVISLLAESSAGATTTKESKFIPYRDSKLTSLLKQSLGGNSFCLMIACVTPLDLYVEESLSTLQYASMASSIVNAPVKNEDDKTKLIKELKRKNLILEQELALANNHIAFLTGLTGEKMQNFGQGAAGETLSEALESEEKKSRAIIKQESQIKQTIGSDMEPGQPVLVHDLADTGSRKTSELPKAHDLPDISLKSENLPGRLCEAITMLKEVLQSNNSLRGSMEEYSKELSKYKSEAYELHVENQSLRDKVTVYEANARSKRGLKSEQDNGALTLKELLGLRSYCKQLEVQLKYTEFEKLKMAKELSYVGNKEPTHPIFLETIQHFPTLTGKKPVRTSRSILMRSRTKSKLNIPTTRLKVNSSSSALGLGSEDSDNSRGYSSRK